VPDVDEALPAVTAPPVEPLVDTWDGADDAGSWSIVPAGDEAAPANAWADAALAATARAFDGFARPWSIVFSTVDRDDVAPVALVPEGGERPDTFVERARAAIRAYAAPVHSVELQLEMLVRVRTPASPLRPVRVWTRLPADIELRAPGPGRRPYASLSVSHTLFRPESSFGGDNRELAALNAPLLASSLRRWEERLGPITDVDGLTGVSRYGFEPEDG
jgi:hypothetical protein